LPSLTTLFTTHVSTQATPKGEINQTQEELARQPRKHAILLWNLEAWIKARLKRRTPVVKDQSMP
jgi:hypothetical protein